MRIGMILDKTFPPDPRVENEAVSLLNAGHKVFLFCLGYGNFPVKETIEGTEIRRYKSNKLEYKLSALAYTFPFYTDIMKSKIKHFLTNNSIEAIHIHDIRIADAVFKANDKLNLPIVLDLHDNMPEVMQFYPHLQKFPGKYLISPQKWKQKEEEFIQKATKIVTVSNEFKKEVIGRTKIDNSKIVVVPNTVRKNFYQKFTLKNDILERYKNSYVILYIGDTGLRRGLQTAIEATTKLKDKILNLKLVIVGKNTTDYVLKQQVKKLNLYEFVDLEGWQSMGSFPSYIMASSVCISPLHCNIQHDVAYANKLFQYMSLGKPVLVSNATAQKNLIEKVNSGLVHEDRNDKDFAAKVLKLYTNRDFAKELGENGKKFIENEFYWEKTSLKLTNLYNNLAR
ncbi:MAG: glycosyl transferase [Flavobacteriales bacterium]|nr:MAG: glycosyl transferase [Flavobacteriales bacterium]